MDSHLRKHIRSDMYHHTHQGPDSAFFHRTFHPTGVLHWLTIQISELLHDPSQITPLSSAQIQLGRLERSMAANDEERPGLSSRSPDV